MSKANKNIKSRKNRLQLKSFVRRPELIAAVLVVVGMACAGYLTSTGRHARKVSATSNYFCSQNGTGYCLNDWNGGGLGNGVLMYRSGVSHEDFHLTNAYVCNGSFYVTSTCPFSHTNLDSQYKGHRIYEVEYVPNGLCVGSGQVDARGRLEYCSGANRGYGVIMISSSTELINRYWSDAHDSAVGMCSSGSSAGPVYLNGVIGGGSCNWLQVAK